MLETYARYELVPYLDSANQLIHMGHAQFSEEYYGDAELTLQTHCSTNHVRIADGLRFAADTWIQLVEHEMALETL